MDMGDESLAWTGVIWWMEWTRRLVCGRWHDVAPSSGRRGNVLVALSNNLVADGHSGHDVGRDGGDDPSAVFCV